ncbi:BON domain-containing protein [Curtobacterium flaccumfaciens]|uniref:BON domain-containing protein n=1 Tax=Curtobacterium flaccumfaciens TaxID=2035 RepID=UPI00112BEEF7|nr:BON domain-containing protein [Curtobacterium flaccumfaciens]
MTIKNGTHNSSMRSRHSSGAQFAPSVQSEILARWRDEQTLRADSLKVQVDVGGNCITLLGRTGSERERVLAETLASRSLPGMPVVNRIEPRLS